MTPDLDLSAESINSGRGLYIKGMFALSEKPLDGFLKGLLTNKGFQGKGRIV